VLSILQAHINDGVIPSILSVWLPILGASLYVLFISSLTLLGITKVILIGIGIGLLAGGAAYAIGVSLRFRTVHSRRVILGVTSGLLGLTILSILALTAGLGISTRV